MSMAEPTCRASFSSIDENLPFGLAHLPAQREDVILQFCECLALSGFVLIIDGHRLLGGGVIIGVRSRQAIAGGLEGGGSDLLGIQQSADNFGNLLGADGV